MQKNIGVHRMVDYIRANYNPHFILGGYLYCDQVIVTNLDMTKVEFPVGYYFTPDPKGGGVISNKSTGNTIFCEKIKVRRVNPSQIF